MDQNELMQSGSTPLRARGAFGAVMTEVGNASPGDEAICLAAARRLIGFGGRLTVVYRTSLEAAFCAAGIEVRHVHAPLEVGVDGVETREKLVAAVESKSPKTLALLRRELATHDVVFVAPGGKFTEGFNNPRALVTAAVALELGVPVVVMHQSVGPIEDSADRRLIADVFSGCELVLVRDTVSHEFLLSCGLSEERVILSGDAALGETYPVAGDPEFDLGLNLRVSPIGHVDHDAVLQFVSNFQREFAGERVHVYSTTRQLPDLLQSRLVDAGCHVQTSMSGWPEYLREPGRSAINLSDSFHGVLFSMMAGRPVIPCQTDLRTWKLRGIHPPDSAPLLIRRGFVDAAGADELLEAVRGVKEAHASVLEYQMRLLNHGRALANDGWARVGEVVARIASVAGERG